MVLLLLALCSVKGLNVDEKDEPIMITA